MLNIGNIIGKFIKNSSQRELERLRSTVKKISDLELKTREMSSDSFQRKRQNLDPKLKVE